MGGCEISLDLCPPVVRNDYRKAFHLSSCLRGVMGMKKGLAVLLVLGLLLLGVSPVWAEGRVLEQTVLPQNEMELTDSELNRVEGQWLPLAAAVVGLILLSSLRSCSVSVDVNSDGNPEFQGEATYGTPRWKPVGR